MRQLTRYRAYAAFWHACTRLFTVVLAGVVLALSPTHHATAADAPCENPATVLFGVIPAEKEPAYAEKIRQYYTNIVLPHLRQHLEKDVKLFQPTGYKDLVEAIKKKVVHVAILGAYTYFLINANANPPHIEAFATYKRPQGHVQQAGTSDQSVLITKAGTFSNYQALKGQEVHVAADAESTSGNLVPHALFAQKVNTDLRDYFRVNATYGQDTLIKKVHAGTIKAAFVGTHRFDQVVEQERFKSEDFTVLWRSEDIPGDPVIYRAALCKHLKKRIKETFLSLHKQPDAKPLLAYMQADEFVEISPTDYDIIGRWKQIRNDVEHGRK